MVNFSSDIIVLGLSSKNGSLRYLWSSTTFHDIGEAKGIIPEARTRKKYKFLKIQLTPNEDMEPW